jgi:hypothetical protein
MHGFDPRWSDDVRGGERSSVDGRHGGRAAVEPQEFDLERYRI